MPQWMPSNAAAFAPSFFCMPSAFLRQRLYWFALAAIFVLSLWIRMAFPISALGFAVYDDRLFVHHAIQIGIGDWLGPYNNLTHAKGIVYSLFLALNHGIGLPLKFSEQAFYLAAALYFAVMVGRIYRSRWAAIMTFVILAFFPVVWQSGAGGRVVREGIYVSLSLLLLTLGLRCWALPASAQAFGTPAEHLRQKWPALLALGLVAGLFWLTREEGVWLLPAMLVFLAYWLWQQRKSLRHLRPLFLFMLLPVAAATLVVGAVNTTNYAYYGVFRNNDFRSGDFQEGYAALTRIRHDAWRPYVLFPADARKRAYAMSAAARELQPYLEGPGGEFWRKAGCEQTHTDPCPEILSGWFMWAFRDAVAHAGHYRDARSARTFYRRLAAEIDAGCQRQPGECGPRRKTLVPPWKDRYALDTLKAAQAVFRTLSTLGGVPPDIGQSGGTPLQVEIFDAVTNGPLAPTASDAPMRLPNGTPLISPRDHVRYALAHWLTQVESAGLAVGLPLALLVWALWLLSAVFLRRRLEITLVLTTALVAAVATRVMLLAFLDATSIPSNYMLYLMPVAPMALALPPVVFWGLLRFVRPQPSEPLAAISN